MTTCSNCGHHAEQTFMYCPSCGTQAVAGGEQGMAGRILGGKYRVLETLGAGAMGTVYLGEHVALKKRIALKVLHKELQVGEEAWKRFQREGIAAGQVNHPNAIQIFDFDRTDEGLCFLAMEHVEGQNLKAWLEQHGAMNADAALGLMRQLLSTLGEAHAHGIVHRDLKPENLMVQEGRDGELHLKVLDFGLSKLVDRPLDASMLTMSGRVMGTPLYMAPEQWNGEEVDARSDLYAAALILYELLTGKQPFKGSNLTETLVKSTTEPPPSMLTQELREPLPVDLDEVVLRGLEKDRDARFQTAADLQEALDAVRMDRVSRGGKPVRRKAVPTAGAARRARGPGRGRAPAAPPGARRTALLGGTAAAVVLTAAALWWFVGGDSAAATPLVRMKEPGARTEQEREYLGLLDETMASLRSGDVAAARASVDRAVRHPRTDAEALATRAAVFRSHDDGDAAAQDYREALSMWPQYAAAEAGLGWIALDRGAADDAERHFRAARQLDQGAPTAIAGLGAVLVGRGAFAEARDLLTPALERSPDAAELFVWHGQALLGLDAVEPAIQSFVQAKRKDPSQWQALAGLGDAYARKGDVDRARREYADALELAGAHRGLRQRLAELLVEQQLWDEADKALAPALQGAQPDGALFLLKGLAAHGRGDVAAATAALARAVELGLQAPAPAELLLASLHLEAERWDDADRHAEAALAADDALARAHRVLGVARFRLQRYPEAAAAFERAIELDADDLLARHSLGVLCMDYLRRPDDATAQFRAYRERGGDDARVVDWLRRLAR
ncbi:MAG: protein kinase [Planctomycetota bacterium]